MLRVDSLLLQHSIEIQVLAVVYMNFMSHVLAQLLQSFRRLTVHTVDGLLMRRFVERQTLTNLPKLTLLPRLSCRPVACRLPPRMFGR